MEIRGYLIDVEGVLVGDKRYLPVETAVEFMTRLRESGRPLRLITNNTTDDPRVLIEKLRSAGFHVSMEELHTSTAAALMLLKSLRSARCLVLGNSSLRRMFEQAGLEVVDHSGVDAVVVGLDTEFTYEKLSRACEAISKHHAAFVALHRNRHHRDAAGRQAPSAGAIVAAIEYTTQVNPIIIGKPSASFFKQALDDLHLAPKEVLVISDDPLSDLAGAKQMGMKTAFVLSGKYDDATVLDGIRQDERPDVIAARIGDLMTEGVIDP